MVTRAATPRIAGLVLVAVVLVGSACGGADSTPPNSSPPGASFDGTSWRLTAGTLDGVPLDLGSGAQPTLVVDEDGVLGGNSGCNLFGGTLAVTGDGTLSIQVGQMTEMACEPGRMNLEASYVDALSRVSIFVWNGDELSLTSDDGIVALDFVAVQPEADRPLDGTTWVFDGFMAGGAVSSPVAGVDAFVVFDLAAGAVRGRGGCNDFGARVAIDGDGLVVSEMVSTEVACETPIMRQEAELLDIVNWAETWQIDGTHLTITSDTRSARFVAAN